MPLDQNFIQQTKQILLKEEVRLKDELADFTVKTDQGGSRYAAIFPDYGDKSGENASEVAAFDNDLALKKVLESDLRDVRSALKAIKAGKYGICKYCGKEINQDRLKARPTSSSCVACKKSLSGE